MSFDSRCYDLAEIFLADEPNVTEAHKNALAQEIQTTIEDFIKFELAVEPIAPHGLMARKERASVTASQAAKFAGPAIAR